MVWAGGRGCVRVDGRGCGGRDGGRGGLPSSPRRTGDPLHAACWLADRWSSGQMFYRPRCPDCTHDTRTDVVPDPSKKETNIYFTRGHICYSTLTSYICVTAQVD